MGTYKRTGFARIKIRDVPEWSGEAAAPRWVSMKPMAHLPSTIEPGAMLISIYKCPKVPGDRKACEVRAAKFLLRVYACMARHLESMQNPVPSAFLHVSCAGETRQTETVHGTTAPIWNQCVTLPIRLLVAVRDSKGYPEPIQL